MVNKGGHMKAKPLIGFIMLALILNVSFQELVVAESGRRAAPEIVLANIDGDSFLLSDYNGRNHVVLMFWTIKGLYCASQLKELKEKYADLQAHNFEVVAVNIKDQKEQIRNFVQQEEIPFPVCLDKDQHASKKYEITGLPVIVIIDEEGQIKWRGYKFPKKYLEFVQ